MGLRDGLGVPLAAELLILDRDVAGLYQVLGVGGDHHEVVRAGSVVGSAEG